MASLCKLYLGPLHWPQASMEGAGQKVDSGDVKRTERTKEERP